MDSGAINNNLQFLSGGGEMGMLTRAKDWSKASIGSPENWPQSLRTTLGLLLNSKFPMFLWWGPELTCFYNDAYRPSLGQNGKHPSILGMSAEEAWPEIWDIISPLIRYVITTGDATWHEDQLVPIYRNGKIEDVYWTFSYSPVYGDDAHINGVFVTCTETTQKVLDAKKLEQSVKNLHNIILQAPVAMCIFKGPQHVVEIANDRMFELWGKPGSDLLNKPIFEALPEVRGQGYEELLNKVYTTGETFTAYGLPVTLPRNGHIENVFVNFVYEAYREEEGIISGVMAVANEVTEQVMARKKIEVSEKRLEKIAEERTKELLEAKNILEQKNIDLEKMNQELQSFAYVASHDLQEPLRKIQTISTRLLGKEYDNLSEYGKDYFKRMQKAADRMQTLIQDLLAYSRTNNPERIFKMTDLNKIVSEVKEDLKEALTEKHATIETGDMCEASIIPFQFRQLLSNIISNSLKFSKPEIPPHIILMSEVVKREELPSEPLSHNKEYCHISIADNGIGFDPKYKDRIFEVFQRLHGNYNYSGTGIGLAIVKKIVENHKGFIAATSELNKGARFDVYIPA